MIVGDHVTEVGLGRWCWLVFGLVMNVGLMMNIGFVMGSVAVNVSYICIFLTILSLI